MSSDNFYKVVGTIFAIVSIAHFLRLFFGWSFVLFGYDIPVWFSIVPTVILGYLSYTAFKLGGLIK